jgi:hypothetical protein
MPRVPLHPGADLIQRVGGAVLAPLAFTIAAGARFAHPRLFSFRAFGALFGRISEFPTARFARAWQLAPLFV